MSVQREGVWDMGEGELRLAQSQSTTSTHMSILILHHVYSHVCLFITELHSPHNLSTSIMVYNDYTGHDVIIVPCLLTWLIGLVMCLNGGI